MGNKKFRFVDLSIQELRCHFSLSRGFPLDTSTKGALFPHDHLFSPFSFLVANPTIGVSHQNGERGISMGFRAIPLFGTSKRKPPAN